MRHQVLRWQRRQRSDRRGAGFGFTVLEMVFSLAILSLALLMASRLLLAAQSRLAHAAEQLIEPAGTTATVQLRADLRAASSFARPLIPGWSLDALVLFGHPAGLVSYEKIDGELIRKVTDGEGTVSERLILQQVTAWRWRAQGRSVEIDLRYRRLGQLRQQMASGRWQNPALPETRRLLRVTPRAGGSQRW